MDSMSSSFYYEVDGVSAEASETDRSFSEWSSPLPFLVDRLVEILRRTHRWHEDGPSLRLVDRYWSRQINQHITCLHPPQGKGAAKPNLQSLLRFPNLTSLHLNHFLSPLEDLPMASAHWLSKREEKRIVKGKIESVLAVVSQLTHLKHLELSPEIFDFQFETKTVGVWTRLKGLQSLHVDVRHGRCFGQAVRLDVLLKEFPYLKRVNLRINHRLFQVHWARLRRLESVEIRFRP